MTAETSRRNVPSITNTPALTPRLRRGMVWDGMHLGYTARQIADYLQVSETTIRRDMRRLGPHPEAGMPDADRCRPGDRGMFL